MSEPLACDMLLAVTPDREMAVRVDADQSLVPWRSMPDEAVPATSLQPCGPRADVAEYPSVHCRVSNPWSANRPEAVPPVNPTLHAEPPMTDERIGRPMALRQASAEQRGP